MDEFCGFVKSFERWMRKSLDDDVLSVCFVHGTGSRNFPKRLRTDSWYVSLRMSRYVSKEVLAGDIQEYLLSYGIFGKNVEECVSIEEATGIGAVEIVYVAHFPLLNEDFLRVNRLFFGGSDV